MLKNMVCRWPRCPSASPQTWVLAMKNPRILRGLRRFYRNVKLYGELWKYFVAGLGMFAVGLYIRTFNLTIIPSICVTVLSCVVVYFILLNILNAKIIRPIKEIAKQFRSK